MGVINLTLYELMYSFSFDMIKLFVFLSLNIDFALANSVDPDEMQHYTTESSLPK